MAALESSDMVLKAITFVLKRFRQLVQAVFAGTCLGNIGPYTYNTLHLTIRRAQKLDGVLNNKIFLVAAPEPVFVYHQVAGRVFYGGVVARHRAVAVVRMQVLYPEIALHGIIGIPYFWRFCGDAYQKPLSVR